jgi:excisionase family DNA binding protein
MSKAKAKTTVTNEATPMSAAEPLLVRPPEAARMLNLGERKLWEMTNRKRVPHVRIGKAVRYSPEDLRAWIQEQTIAA